MEPMPRRLAIPTFALVAGVTSACTGSHAVSQDVSGSNGYQTGNKLLTFVSLGSRHSAVTGVTGNLISGGHFDLANWRGKVVVVNFWGSWCAPCHSEAQALEQVYKDDENKGVEFVGIDVKDDPASAQAFMAKFDVTYPVVNDPSNLLALRFHGVPPSATPTTVVIDRAGRIAARQSGEILYTQLRDVVDHVLSEPV
jgi:thiol-disulfide isomerase/thioredoxin